jgi:hypothetical protein
MMGPWSNCRLFRATRLWTSNNEWNPGMMAIPRPRFFPRRVIVTFRHKIGNSSAPILLDIDRDDSDQLGSINSRCWLFGSNQFVTRVQSGYNDVNGVNR